VDQLALGIAHACARLGGGGVACWGLNGNGQLGLGDTTDSHPTPTVVSSITGVVDLCAGGQFTCAIDAAGAVWCWGDDSFGQLGRGTTTATAQTMPAPSLVTTGALDVECGYRHACAVVDTGTGVELRCWGGNTQGEVGVVPSTSEPIPRAVASIATPTLLALGGREPLFASAEGVSCASTGAGLSCWGSNDLGQLGRGTMLPRRTETPASVASLSGEILDADVGYMHAGAIERFGAGSRARCWGTGTNGALGDSLRRDSASPVTVLGLP
jgi:alpha-tubulin suppressor-like RCC1 family protein